MREHFHESGAGIGRPQRYGAVLMTNVDDSIVWILCQCSRRSLFCGELNDHLPCRGIGILQISSVALHIVSLLVVHSVFVRTHHCSEQEVMLEKFHIRDFNVLLETM